MNKKDTQEYDQTPPESEAEAWDAFDPIIRQPTTVEIKQDMVIKQTTRCGELYAGKETSLMLAFPRSNEPPLRINVIYEFVFGRTQSQDDAALDLDLSDYAPHSEGISRRHAMLFRQDDILHIMDLGSTNGTFLNGEKLVPFQSRFLRDGDYVCLGRLSMVVLFMPEKQAADLDITYESPTQWVVRIM